MTDVVVARHGETEWSRNGRHTSRTELPLTDLGEDQARSLGRRLAGASYALVLTSPRRRAVDTCRLAGVGAGAQLREDLTEWDYGDYEGVTTAEIHRTRPGWDLFRDGAPGGESPADVAARVDRVIAEVRTTAGTVLVVAHGHVLRVLAARWVGLAAGEGRVVGPLGTGATGHLGWERRAPTVLAWNA